MIEPEQGAIIPYVATMSLTTATKPTPDGALRSWKLDEIVVPATHVSGLSVHSITLVYREHGSPYPDDHLWLGAIRLWDDPNITRCHFYRDELWLGQLMELEQKAS